MEAVWQRDVSGHAMFRVCQKLRALKPILRRLNKDNMDSYWKIRQAEEEFLKQNSIRLLGMLLAVML